MMAGDQHFTRVNLVEAKTLIAKKFGAQKSEKYFNLLNRFLTKKLCKSEFNKLCIVAIGRENISIHNWFIRSIVKNACLSAVPQAKASKLECTVNGKVANGYQKSSLQSLCRDVCPQSPQRGRTPSFRDRKSRDRPSPLGPHGKSHTAACIELAPKALEQQSATELHSLGSRPVEVTSVEDGEEVDQDAGSPGIRSRSPVTAPLGIQIHAKGPRKVFSFLPSSPVPMDTCYSAGELPDTSSLRRRVEQKLEAEGLKVSVDYVNLLNNSLDVYLKRLIKPCLEMANSRDGNKQIEQVRVQMACGINMMRPMSYIKRPAGTTPASLVDLRAAMELNPNLLGENWPLQLEKVSLQQDWE